MQEQGLRLGPRPSHSVSKAGRSRAATHNRPEHLRRVQRRNDLASPGVVPPMLHVRNYGKSRTDRGQTRDNPQKENPKRLKAERSRALDSPCCARSHCRLKCRYRSSNWSSPALHVVADGGASLPSLHSHRHVCQGVFP